MPQWSAGQIHDTVAAIARQPVYGSGTRRSLLGRVLRFLGDRLSDLFHAAQGSLSGRIVLGVTIAALVFVLVARIIVDRRLAEARRARGGSQSRAGTRIDYWKAASELAGSGRFADACHALHAAVIDELARSGLVKWHASKTNGDYARELRRRNPALHSGFRSFARDFERVAFGTRQVEADDYTRLRAAAESLNARRAAA